MYLSQLEIVGFKSFANKTVLKFSDGITSVVGPNGCGKTNIVDAIRWVLGEQKTSVLRSEVMENVIFNGSGNRKPLGLSEVTLTLQNNKNVLPTEFSEVTVCRRLFRNGESQYLINNTQCRLRDIIDLFMDTGMGADSYSVIELKMVESILNGKAEERRHLIEEAAGVTKYKFKRKEAGKKLQNVQGDLVRVNDILIEVQKNVASLSRQASKTKRYNNLLNELKTLEIELIKNESLKISKDIASINSEMGNILQSKISQETALEGQEEQLRTLNKNLRELEHVFALAQEKENSINNVIHEKSQKHAITKEKIESLNDNQEKIRQEIKETYELIEKTKLAITEAKANINIFTLNKTSAESDLKKLNSDTDTARNSLISSRNDYNVLNEDLLNHQNKKDSLIASSEKNQNRKAGLIKTIEEQNHDVQKISIQISEIESIYNTSFSNKDELSHNLENAENNYKKSLSRISELQQNLENLRNKLSSVQNESNLKSASLDFIINLVDNDETSKYLHNSKEWKPSGEKIQLAEAIGVDDDIRIALDSALGDAIRYFIVENKNEALEAIKMLKSDKKGRATFLCKDSIPHTEPPHETDKEKGKIGWLSEIVRVEDTLRNALRCILGKTLLVDNFATAQKLLPSGIASAYVTLDGEIIRSTGTIRGGSVPNEEILTLGKKEKIAGLKKEISALEKEIISIKTNIEKVKSEIDLIDIEELNGKVRNATAEKNENEQFIAQNLIKKESLENNILLIEKNIQRFNEDIDLINKEEKEIQAELSGLDNLIASARTKQETAFSKLKESEEILIQCENNSRNAEIHFVRMDEELKNINKEIGRLEIQLQDYEHRIEKNQSELKQNENRLIQLAESQTLTEAELSHLQITSETAKSEREELHEQITALQEQIQQYTDTLSMQRKTFERTTQEIHEKELKIAELKSKIETLYQRANENYNIDLSVTELQETPDFSIYEARNNTIILKERLTQLGNVNFMALEEFEEQSSRLQFLTKQVNDLEDSEKNLRETITEINQTAEKKFIDTFELVNQNFKKLFSTLFGKEGQAQLNLTTGDPLESNIEIIAKPPGKKPHSIEMLSGGEKTLTAIALLFAIYLVKPSPFCILDEVDAPLDDANIDRFLLLIREFSANTQFLVVTHNKRTMEASDTLYGITMHEEGVSKVVSVKLASEINN